MESEKIKEIKKALEERTQHKPINCYNGEYVEACGMYCRFYRKFVADMGINNKQTCENCGDFTATDNVKISADILTLINDLESENERLQKDCADIANDYQEMGKFYYEEFEKNQQLQLQLQDALTAENVIKIENSEITESESIFAKAIYQELIELSEDPSMTREEIYEKVFSKYGINVEV